MVDKQHSGEQANLLRRPGIGEQLLSAGGHLGIALPNELARAQALVEILCAAAQVDDELDPDEGEAIDVQLRPLLGLEVLPPGLPRHVPTFTPLHPALGQTAPRIHHPHPVHKKRPSTMSGDGNRAFATLMPNHHKMAIDMADVLLKSGSNAELKAIAAKMKAAQQDEIKQLEPFTR